MHLSEAPGLDKELRRELVLTMELWKVPQGPGCRERTWGDSVLMQRGGGLKGAQRGGQPWLLTPKTDCEKKEAHSRESMVGAAERM